LPTKEHDGEFYHSAAYDRRVPVRPTLLYDDDCRFCRACADLIKAWDRRGRMALLPFSDPEARQMMSAIVSELRERSMHVVQPSGAIESGGDAMVAVLEALPGLRWLAWLSRRVSLVRGAVAWTYFVVASRRDFFSRLVPNRPAPVRWP
jgi:predicted DCC family thiol-disulfide oxidoreductase YuxK